MKKIIMVVLMVALFAGAAGVGVHVMHKDAYATNQSVKIVVFDWNGLAAYNIQAVAMLLDADQEILRQINLNADPTLSIYTGDFQNIPSTAVEVKVVWNVAGRNWDPTSGVVEDVVRPDPVNILIQTQCW